MTDQPIPSWLSKGRGEPWDPKTEPRAQAHLPVIYDLYPARICPGDTGSVKESVNYWRARVRVIVSADHAYFFVDSPEYPGIALLHDAPLVSHYGSKKDPLGITLVFENETIRLFPDKGCGCGSRLRSLRPFPSSSSMSK